MSVPFIRARHYRQGGNLPVRHVTVHTMQAPEKLTTAEATARYFARGTVVASAHYCCDADSIVQCVLEADTAFHAPPNRYSVGVELSGYAEQTSAQWSDEFSRHMLDHAASLVAGLCQRHGLPVVWLSPMDLRAGKRGITSHHNVSQAFGQSSHWDPGGGFPVDYFIDRVRAASAPDDEPIASDPPVTLTGGRKMRQLIAVGPLDSGGNGWTQTEIPFPAWESATANAVDPQVNGQYGPEIIVSACDHSGKVRIVVQGGEPRTTVGIYAVWSA